MPVSIPGEASEVINRHMELIESNLPGLLDSYHIYGSISLDAFDHRFSDIDFVAVLKRKAAEKEIEILKKIHRDMNRRFKKPILDGMYLSRGDFEALNNEEAPCLRFNDGEFKGLKTLSKNTIDAYQLQKRGITVKGRGIGEQDYKVDFDLLVRNMRENINTYWLRWVNACRRFPSIGFIGLFFSLKAIEWGVLGVTRQYYTFRERDITSKTGAGEYALRQLPEKWHKIVMESMRLRRNIGKSYYKSVFTRRNDALGYMDYIIRESNGLFNSLEFNTNNP